MDAILAFLHSIPSPRSLAPMTLLVVTVALLASLGHAAVCIFLNNRLHATGWPRPVVHAGSLLFHALTSVGACLWFWWLAVRAPAHWAASETSMGMWFLWCYVAVCCLIAVGPLPWSLCFGRRLSPPPALQSNHTLSLDLRRRLGSHLAAPGFRRWAILLPGNEVLRLDVNEKILRVPRLAPALDGLSIAHLSDLHLTGLIRRPYFEEVIQQTNAMQADLVAITGDLLDKDACRAWIPDTLGRLEAKHGVYFVLGNHDRRVDWALLRHDLQQSGLIDLGGRWQSIPTSAPVILAGNELPWFRPAADMSDCPERVDGKRPLRVLLSHSPDQIRWAQQRDFDLLLAGHNHGGQIRLPLIGPVVSPSYYGVKYASGTFDEPPTLIHVSRGVSAKTPLRFNCPPEVTKLVLRASTDA